jgi:hypothetical protein
VVREKKEQGTLGLRSQSHVLGIGEGLFLRAESPNLRVIGSRGWGPKFRVRFTGVGLSQLLSIMKGVLY